MRGVPLGCLALGVAGLVLSAILAASGSAVMPAYLAAWLFWLALPLGALALLTGLEALGLGAAPLAGCLRLVLLPLPAVAVLGLPVLLAWRGLYPRPASGFAAGWFAPGLVLGRGLTFLVVWALLGLLFQSPGRARGVAVPLLLLHVAMLTLAAIDWVGAAEPGFSPSMLGLVLLAAQCGIALSAAVLMLTLGRTRLPPVQGSALAVGLLALLGAWAFLHFVQYLVVWSANLPREIVWYQQREAGLGMAAAWFALAVMLATLALLLPRGLARRAPVLAGVAGLLLALHLVEMLWLVTPSWRGTVALTLADPAALVGVGGVMAACFLALARRPGTEHRLGLA